MTEFKYFFKGLVEILFPTETTKVSLVSDGAECIMINKKFFIEHLTEEARKQLKIKVRKRLRKI